MPRLLERKFNALSVKRLTKPGRHADGSGLYLNVEKTGAKNWLLRVTVKGRARTIGLGSYLDVTLAEAREKASRLRKVAKEGGDPIAERDGKFAANAAPTFENAANQFHIQYQDSWKCEKHKRQWLSSLRDHVFAGIGQLCVDEINSDHVLRVLEPIWLNKPKTAINVKQRMKSVFDWSIAKRYRDTMNPVDAVRMALPKQSKSPKHHASLQYDELPAFLHQLQGSNSSDLVKISLTLLIHTALRTNEVLKSEWGEVDINQAVWTIPAERMKAGKEHRVPLSSQAIEVLNLARQYQTNSPFIFPGQSGNKPLSEYPFRMALSRMGRDDITIHGFRSSFRNWTADCTNEPREICEMALAHSIRDQTEAAYNRTDLLNRRRALMNLWSEFLVNVGDGNPVQGHVRRCGH